MLLADASETIYDASHDEQAISQLGRARIHSARAEFDEPVLLHVTVDKQGKVISAPAFDGPSSAFREAELAEKRLTFRPVRLNGVPVSASFVDSVSVFPPELWCRAAESFPPIRDPSTMRIRLERRYPSFEPHDTYYVVTITGDRWLQVTWVNKGFPDPGGHSRRISPDSYRQLIDQFRRANFFSMCESYIVEMTMVW